MEEKETIENLKVKIKEIKSMSGLNSRNFRFKNWHASTLNLLKNLSSDYTQEIVDFKSLTFEDTKYHRGRKFLNQPDNTKFREDLGSASKILGEITSGGKRGYKTKNAVSSEVREKKDAPVNNISKSSKTKKPDKPPKKIKSKGKSMSGTGAGGSRRTGPKKHEPAKRGSSTARKKPGS
jgi:hypothetical protein